MAHSVVSNYSTQLVRNFFGLPTRVGNPGFQLVSN